MCILNIVSWGSCLTIWYHILNSWCYIFLPLIFRRVFRTVWIFWIDWICWIMWIVWSNWSFTMFQSYCPSLINRCICVISSSCWELIAYKNVTTIFIVLNLSCSWVVNSFTRFTTDLIIGKGLTSCLINVLDHCFLVCLTVNNWGISSWVRWCYIWNVCHITWDDWCWCYTTLSWIVWIIRILWSWSIWNLVAIWVNWNNLTEFLINYFICSFWVFWSNCLTTCFSFIRIIVFNYWDFYFAIVMTVFSPCCCAISLILLTCECKVTLNIIFWCGWTSSFKGYCLFSWFCHIIYDWNVDDLCVSWNTIWITLVIWLNRFINNIIAPSLWLFFLNLISSWSIRNLSFCCFCRIR